MEHAIFRAVRTRRGGHAIPLFIRGQAPDSEGGVILKGLEGFSGEPKESPSLRRGIL